MHARVRARKTEVQGLFSVRDQVHCTRENSRNMNDVARNGLVHAINVRGANTDAEIARSYKRLELFFTSDAKSQLT